MLDCTVFIVQMKHANSSGNVDSFLELNSRQNLLPRHLDKRKKRTFDKFCKSYVHVICRLNCKGNHTDTPYIK